MFYISVSPEVETTEQHKKQKTQNGHHHHKDKSHHHHHHKHSHREKSKNDGEQSIKSSTDGEGSVKRSKAELDVRSENTAMENDKTKETTENMDSGKPDVAITAEKKSALCENNAVVNQNGCNEKDVSKSEKIRDINLTQKSSTNDHQIINNCITSEEDSVRPEKMTNNSQSPVEQNQVVSDGKEAKNCDSKPENHSETKNDSKAVDTKKNPLSASFLSDETKQHKKSSSSDQNSNKSKHHKHDTRDKHESKSSFEHRSHQHDHRVKSEHRSSSHHKERDRKHHESKEKDQKSDESRSKSSSHSHSSSSRTEGKSHSKEVTSKSESHSTDVPAEGSKPQRSDTPIKSESERHRSHHRKKRVANCGVQVNLRKKTDSKGIQTSMDGGDSSGDGTKGVKISEKKLQRIAYVQQSISNSEQQKLYAKHSKMTPKKQNSTDVPEKTGVTFIEEFSTQSQDNKHWRTAEEVASLDKYKYKDLFHVEQYSNGGGLVCHAYQEEVNKLSEVEKKEFAREFMDFVYGEPKEGVSNCCMGIVHRAISHWPDLVEHFADTYPNLTVKAGILGKSDIETMTMEKYREQIQKTYQAGTFRCGPLLQVSVVGTAQEEVGDYFPEVLDLFESDPFLDLVMPWGDLSSVRMASRNMSNDGPILWTRPGEQLIPTADMPKSPFKRKR